MHKALLAMGKQQNFQVNRLEYLDMTIYGTYCTGSINEIANAIMRLHINISKQEGILSGKQAYWYKDIILKRRIAQMVRNSLLYLHGLQMKFMNIYEDLVRRLYIYMDVIHIPSTSNLPVG